jgi:hypothetical protein
MKLCILTLTALFTAQLSFSQQITIPTNATSFDILSRNPEWSSTNGHKYSGEKYADVIQGSAYFKDIWMRGTFVVSGGPAQAGFVTRMDLLDNKVHFLNEKGDEMEATMQIQEVFLEDTILGGKYQFRHSNFISNDAIKPDYGWYQVLQDGNASLLKRYKKQMVDTKPDYGSTTVHSKITTDEQFYILNNKRLQQIKRISDMYLVFYDKKAELEDFISKNRLKSREDDYIKIVAKYNSLLTK